MSHTLVIIDMQDRFVYSDKDFYRKCIDGVAKEIRLARRRGDHILVVEYDDAQPKVVSKVGSKVWPTAACLNNLLKGYDKYHYVFKKTNDGGREVVQALKEKRIPRSNVRVCGVYANYCVKGTVLTMAKTMKRSNIMVMKNAIACYSNSEVGMKEALEEMTFLNNVKAIG